MIERRFRPILLALLAALAVGCVVNPATGRRQFSLVSEAKEIEIGRETDPVIQRQMGVYDDAELGGYVQGVGDRLAAVSERSDLAWTFRVVDDPTVNAFALPGGFIYITRGILAHLDSEAELATVMGHEIGHVTARHSADQMTKAQVAQIGLGVGTVVGPDWARQLSDLAGTGLGLLFLKFSRDDERQADDLGLRYLLAAGYDPRPAPGVFDILEQVGAAAGGERVPGWMATHPAPENREAELSRQVAGLDRDFRNAKVGRQEYLAHVDGMVFGANPREGYFDGGRFHHPELEFRFDFPSGWKTVNGRDAVGATSPEQDAIVILTRTSEATPEQALERFFSQEGIASGSSWRDRVGEYSVAARGFRATTSGGTVVGIAVFLRHRDATYRLLGYAKESSWSSRSGAVESALSSFARETDPDVLRVKPARLKIVENRSAVSLTRFAELHDASISADQLALINHVPRDAMLEAGKPYKVVVGGRTP